MKNVHCYFEIFYSYRLKFFFRCCDQGMITENHDRTEITCLPNSNSKSSKNSVIPSVVNMQCDKPIDLKKINRIGNGKENEKLHPYIAKLDNNGTHLTLSYADSDASDGNTALKNYENSTLELDGLHYCVRYYRSFKIHYSDITEL